MNENTPRLRIWIIVILLLALFSSLGYIYCRSAFIAKRTVISQTSKPQISVVTVSGTVGAASRESFTLDSNNRTYRVKLANATITRKPLSIPYLFGAHPAPKSRSASVSDISEKMYVEVSGTLDEHSVIQARTILLPRVTFVLEGLIVSKGAGLFTIDGVPVVEIPMVSSDGQVIPPKHQDYVINITTDTEISREVEGQGPKRYTISDLEVGERVVIYATDNVIKTLNVTAARVEPVL